MPKALVQQITSIDPIEGIASEEARIIPLALKRLAVHTALVARLGQVLVRYETCAELTTSFGDYQLHYRAVSLSEADRVAFREAAVLLGGRLDPLGLYFQTIAARLWEVLPALRRPSALAG